MTGSAVLVGVFVAYGLVASILAPTDATIGLAVVARINGRRVETAGDVPELAEAPHLRVRRRSLAA